MDKQNLKILPLPFDVESKKVLRKTIEATQFLSELKGIVRTIPNEAILINTLILQEAKDSSAIENIITTHDELYKADLFTELINLQTKEVLNYASALRKGFQLISEHGILTSNHICEIQSILESNEAGFRKVKGTKIKNTSTNEVIYEPPQDYDTIVSLMTNLEKYINDSIEDDLHPLVKMAIIHYQFECTHPFYDGNGRTGRIINILYLTLKELLDFPILYLSRYIIRTKGSYYQLLKEVSTESKWEEWILYMLEGVSQTAQETIQLVNEINDQMFAYKRAIKSQYPKIYSKDLLENLFKHPYTRIEYLQNDLGVTYATARNYLEVLNKGGFLSKQKIGKSNYYVNPSLFELFSKE